jgi:hypothetical protein
MPTSPRNWIAEAISASQPDWTQLMGYARREWGRSAAQHVAQAAGVSARTGRRWLASDTTPKSAGARRATTGDIGQGAQRRAAADKARRARKAIAGAVQVYEISPNKASRRRLDGEPLNIRGVMGKVAELIEAGHDDEAAALISGATITAYGGDYVGADCGPAEGLAAKLEVTTWTDGFDLK